VLLALKIWLVGGVLCLIVAEIGTLATKKEGLSWIGRLIILVCWPYVFIEATRQLKDRPRR
jgi:hypothetical protein